MVEHQYDFCFNIALGIGWKHQQPIIPHAIQASLKPISCRDSSVMICLLLKLNNRTRPHYLEAVLHYAVLNIEQHTSQRFAEDFIEQFNIVAF